VGKTIIACIGSGAMGSSLTAGMAWGAARKGEAASLEFVFTDHTAAKAKSAADNCAKAGVSSRTAKNALSAIEGADFVFLAVKPSSYAKTLAEIAGGAESAGKTEKAPSRAEREKKPVLVSFTTGAANNFFAEKCPSFPVIQIMPNTPCRVGRGVTGFCGISASAEQADTLEKALSYAGVVVRVEASKMPAITALAGCGPAYVYMFLDALADAGVRCGLPRAKSLDLAAATLAGAAAMYTETCLHPGVLKDEVCSPAGSTIEGVTVLEERGFRGAVIDAVSASFRRAA